MARQCEFVRPDGTRCRANARAGRSHCFAHDSGSAAERDSARRAGGRARRAAVLPPDTPDVELRTAADVARFLSGTINEVRKGLLDARVGNCVAGLVGQLLRAIQGDEFERRLAAVEAVLKVRGER